MQSQQDQHLGSSSNNAMMAEQAAKLQSKYGGNVPVFTKSLLGYQVFILCNNHPHPLSPLQKCPQLRIAQHFPNGHHLYYILFLFLSHNFDINLIQNRKYFDSGDYALSKAGKESCVGEGHPQPENIPHSIPVDPVYGSIPTRRGSLANMIIQPNMGTASQAL